MLTCSQSEMRLPDVRQSFQCIFRHHLQQQGSAEICPRVYWMVESSRYGCIPLSDPHSHTLTKQQYTSKEQQYTNTTWRFFVNQLVHRDRASRFEGHNWIPFSFP